MENPNELFGQCNTCPTNQHAAWTWVFSVNLWSKHTWTRTKEGSVDPTMVYRVCYCGSVTQRHLTFCEPMDYSTPGSAIPHHLPEFVQTHVHWVSDAIQPSHPGGPHASWPRQRKNTFRSLLYANSKDWTMSMKKINKKDKCLSSQTYILIDMSVNSVKVCCCCWYLSLWHPLDCSTPASLSSTISGSLLKFKSIESMMPFNHLILCQPLLLLSIFPSIRVFSNDSAKGLELQLQHQSFQWIFRVDFL